MVQKDKKTDEKYSKAIEKILSDAKKKALEVFEEEIKNNGLQETVEQFAKQVKKNRPKATKLYFGMGGATFGTKDKSDIDFLYRETQNVLCKMQCDEFGFCPDDIDL